MVLYRQLSIYWIRVVFLQSIFISPEINKLPNMEMFGLSERRKSHTYQTVAGPPC